MDVSRETEERLAILADLLVRWTRRINLVALDTVADLQRRHIEDSAQLLPLAPADWRHWADLGSGAGFPGLVIAILAQDLPGERRVTLVESDGRKSAFLRTVLRETGVTADILTERIETLPPLVADVVSARALAPLPRLLEFAAPHMAPGAMAIFPKGRRADDEVKDALERWRFTCQKIPSATDDEAVILILGEIERA